MYGYLFRQLGIAHVIQASEQLDSHQPGEWFSLEIEIYSLLDRFFLTGTVTGCSDDWPTEDGHVLSACDNSSWMAT